MVIQLIYLQADGSKKTRTYRSVKPWEKSEMMKTFYDQRTLYRGGVMVQLRGTERKLVARFGEEF
jgi:hypothetical protein